MRKGEAYEEKLVSKRRLLALVAAAASVANTGCLFRKAKAQPPPAAPIPAPQPAVAQKPEPIAPPPKVEQQKPDLAEAPAGAQDIDVPQPPPAPPRRPRRPVAQTTPPATSDPVPNAPATPQPEPPRLVQLLSPAEEKRYQTQLDQHLRNVDTVLGQAAARTLNAEQHDVVQRVRTFSQQARDQRNSDLVTAHNLAQRADVLAQDLVRGFR